MKHSEGHINVVLICNLPKIGSVGLEMGTTWCHGIDLLILLNPTDTVIPYLPLRFTKPIYLCIAEKFGGVKFCQCSKDCHNILYALFSWRKFLHSMVEAANRPINLWLSNFYDILVIACIYFISHIPWWCNIFCTTYTPSANIISNTTHY